MSDEGEVRAARGQKQLVKRRTDQVASTYMAPAAGEGNQKRRSGVWGSSEAASSIRQGKPHTRVLGETLAQLLCTYSS